MPIFEFECKECGKVSEEILPMNDETREINCKNCDEGKATRIISHSSFVLVGSGWCKDGYTTSKEKGKAAGVAV